jgi:Flp pilus assembly protein TadD
MKLCAGRPAAPFLPPVSQDTIEGLYATGYWLYLHDRPAYAVSVFRALVQLAPGDERGWLALGHCYESQGQTDVALHVYGSSLRMLANAPRCQLARARVLRAQGRARDAQRALIEAARGATGTDDGELRALIAAEWDLVSFRPPERPAAAATAPAPSDRRLEAPPGATRTV